MEERLLSPGSLTEKFLEAIFQPGVFSSLSLRAAIDQYTEACLSLPGAPPPQLMGAYSTLAETVAAVVGCTVTLHKDPQSGAFQYANYWTALKRDWEGFVARCREVERSARWPLLLASRHAGEPIIIERERAGCIIIQDTPVYLHRLSKAERVTDPNANIFAAAEALRRKLGPEIMSDLESRLLDMMHQEFAFSLIDILQDQANKLQIWEVLDEGSASWIEGRLQSIDNWDDTLQIALQHIGALEYAVKAEEMETDLTTVEAQSDWFRLLTTRYISVVVEARYELSLSLMTIFLYISRELSSSKAAFVGEVFAVFKGAAMLRYVAAQPAERPSKDGSESSFSEDDVVSRLRNMDVSHNRIPASAPTSLVYLLLTQSSDHGVSVPALAHNLLDNTGLLRSVSPSVATTYEVQFCERIRLLRFFEVARELLSCLPRTPASVFVLAQVWLQTGRFDEAAHLFEKLAGSFGMLCLRFNRLPMLIDLLFHRAG
jgi:nuclear pore complex protein Nup160